MEHPDQAQDICIMLSGMIGTLLDLLRECECGVGQVQVQRQIGFVIAEVCSTLSLMDDGLAGRAVSSVLHAIADSVSGE